MKFLKKPVEVDAWQVTDLINRFAAHGVNGLPQPIADAYEEGRVDFPSPFFDDHSSERIDVITLEGIMQAKHGWWIIKGITGELYPCKGSIFRDTYTEIEEHESA